MLIQQLGKALYHTNPLFETQIRPAILGFTRSGDRGCHLFTAGGLPLPDQLILSRIDRLHRFTGTGQPLTINKLHCLVHLLLLC